MAIEIVEVASAADRQRFVELIYTLYAADPHFVPPLRSEARELIDGIRTNPWFEHGQAKLWLALRDGVPVGRISAQLDRLVLEHMGAGVGHWGMFECIDDPAVATALFDTAESWLRNAGMTEAMGPFSLSIWDEPGLLFTRSRRPTVMGASCLLRRDDEALACRCQDLHTYELRSKPFPTRPAHRHRARRAAVQTRTSTSSALRVSAISRHPHDSSDNWGSCATRSRRARRKNLKPISTRI